MKPMVVLSRAGAQCATFYWEGQDAYVGYRFIEHDPETRPRPLSGIGTLPTSRMGAYPTPEGPPLSPQEADPLGRGWLNKYEEKDPDDPIQLSFQSYADGSAWAAGNDNGGAQRREFLFEPADDGVLMWIKLTTSVPILGAFCVQQCLRFSGETNVPWRQDVGLASRLSEFDLQARGKPHDTLTYARRDGQWIRFPLPHTRYHTLPGQPMLGANSDGQVDHGLIVRETLDGTLAAGMYWERTAYISNRHPADCLHASVGFGPLAQGETRLLRGRFYWIEGSKDDLLHLWRREFHDNRHGRGG